KQIKDDIFKNEMDRSPTIKRGVPELNDYGVSSWEDRVMATCREASKRWGKNGASGRELMDQVTGRSRWIAMEQFTESVKREIAKSIAAVQALTWEAIGSRTWESAVVRNRENVMESNRVSDRDIEMKSVTD
ncbi:hypothetical protein HID58_059797, partial [Brassica napus]